MQTVRNIRWALTAFLCIVIWMRTDWVVAMAITLISFSIEAMAISIKVVGDALRAHIQISKKHDEFK